MFPRCCRGRLWAEEDGRRPALDDGRVCKAAEDWRPWLHRAVGG